MSTLPAILITTVTLEKEAPLLPNKLKEDPTSIEPKLITCPEEFVKCSNGITCVPKVWLCDGFNDCPDGSDEGSGN